MACIRKRRGRWIVDYRDVSGKRRWETIEGNRADAEERLAKIVSDGKPVRNSKLTFGEYKEQWLRTYASTYLKGSTVKMYETCLKNYLGRFDRVVLTKITRNMVKELIAEQIKSGLSHSTVRNMIAPLRTILNQAIEDKAGGLISNPAARVGKFNKRKDTTKEINPLTREELTVFVNGVKEKMPHYYPLFLCAPRTGIREGELVVLKYSDVDFNRRFIEVRRNLSNGKITSPKSGKTRRVDMSIQLTNVLDELLAKRKAGALKRELEKPRGERRDGSVVLNEVLDEWIFIDNKEDRLDTHDVRRLFYRALNLAGIRRIRFHDLRHSFASLLLQQGESLVYVKDQLGHSSIRITVDTYGHLVPGSNRQAVDRLDDMEESTQFPDDTRQQSGSKMVADQPGTGIENA